MMMFRAALRPSPTALASVVASRRSYTQVAHSRPRYGLLCAAMLASSGAAYFAGVHYPPSWNPFMFLRAKHEIAGAGTMPDAEYCDAVERYMHQLPFVQQLQAHAVDAASARRIKTAAGVELPAEPPSADDAYYYAIRPFANIPADRLAHNLTGATLRVRDGFAITPLVFSKTAKGAKMLGGRVGDGFAIVHLGRSLSGFEGVVHGGMLATILDEALARSAMHALPHNIGVTARLDINYRRPVRTNEFVVIETSIVESAGRKAIVKAELRDIDSHTVLAEADAVFVEPRMAKYMKWIGGIDVHRMIEQ